MKLRFALPWVLLAAVTQGCGSDDEGDECCTGTDAGVLPDASYASDAPKPSPDGGVNIDAGRFDALPSRPDSAVALCRVAIRPVTTAVLTNIAAGDRAFVRLRGEILGEPRPQTPQWTWQVTLDGTPQPIGGADDTDPALADIPLRAPGEYEVTLSVSDTCIPARERVTAVFRQTRSSFFVVRLVPPAESGLPPQDIIEELQAGANKQADLRLSAGPDVAVVPRKVGGINVPHVFVPSFVRISSSGSSFEREGIASGANGFRTKLVQGHYNVLVVPQDMNLPPLLIPGRSSDVLRPLYVDLTEGVLIQGHVNIGGRPLSGTRLMLRQVRPDTVKEQQPSTVGTSGADGAYSLRARPGLHTLRLVPPESSPLPTLELQPSQAVTIAEGATAKSLTIDYATTPAAALTMSVVQPDGATPAPGTRAFITTDKALEEAGSLIVDGSAPQPLRGDVALAKLTDADGRIRVEGLPRAIYNITLRPPRSRTWPAAFQTPFQVDLRGGDVTMAAKLSASVKVTSRLEAGGQSAAGLRVAAVETEGNGDAEEAYAEVSEDGSFVLTLSPGREYNLRVDPPVGRLVPRRVFGSIKTAKADFVLPPFPPLAASLRFSGRVWTNAGNVLPGTVLQVFCIDDRSDCIDNSVRNVGALLPISEAVAGPDGTFVLVLPDPGS